MKYIGNSPGIEIVQSYSDKWDYINASDPAVDTNPSSLYATWLNISTGASFVCLDNTTDANVWALSGPIDWNNPVSVTTSATLQAGKHHVCSGTSADYTVTLPAAASNGGKQISVAMSSALTKLVTVDGNGSELIDGETTRIMWAGESALLLCDGTGWTKIAGKSIPMRFAAYPTGSQASLVSGTYNTVAFDAEHYDHGGVFASNALTVKRPMLWMLNAAANMNGIGGNLTRLILDIKSDGTLRYRGGSFYPGTGASETATVSYHTEATVGEAFTIEAYAAVSAGTFTIGYGQTNVQYYTYFQGTEVCTW